ncbi:MAG: hypothetical protein SFU98_09145 [Leptospiraceae bacterium]|nr:hypothetical protein [Leptospiraceae bacterium]
MTKKLIFSALSILLVGCMGVTSVKSIANVDIKSTGNRIQKTLYGNTFLFGAIPVGDYNSLDSKEAIETLAKVSSCKDLKNIDLEFFTYNFLVVGYQKMIVKADCSRE